MNPTPPPNFKPNGPAGLTEEQLAKRKKTNKIIIGTFAVLATPLLILIAATSGDSDKKATEAAPEATTAHETTATPAPIVATVKAPFVTTMPVSLVKSNNPGLKMEFVDMLPQMQQAGIHPAEKITTKTRSVIASDNWRIVAQCSYMPTDGKLTVGVVKNGEYREIQDYNNTLLNLGLAGSDTGTESPGSRLASNSYESMLDCPAP